MMLVAAGLPASSVRKQELAIMQLADAAALPAAPPARPAPAGRHPCPPAAYPAAQPAAALAYPVPASHCRPCPPAARARPHPFARAAATALLESIPRIGPPRLFQG